MSNKSHARCSISMETESVLHIEASSISRSLRYKESPHRDGILLGIVPYNATQESHCLQNNLVHTSHVNQREK